jgi:hypothetical protein
MNTHTRRAFLGFARGAVATAAIGALGARFIEVAEAMPIAPDSGKLGTEIGKSSPLVTQAQWGPPPRGRRRPPVRRRRRWVCWWRRGRRVCGWRWV